MSAGAISSGVSSTSEMRASRRLAFRYGGGERAVRVLPRRRPPAPAGRGRDALPAPAPVARRHGFRARARASSVCATRGCSSRAPEFLLNLAFDVGDRLEVGLRPRAAPRARGRPVVPRALPVLPDVHQRRCEVEGLRRSSRSRRYSRAGTRARRSSAGRRGGSRWARCSTSRARSSSSAVAGVRHRRLVDRSEGPCRRRACGIPTAGSGASGSRPTSRRCPCTSGRSRTGRATSTSS